MMKIGFWTGQDRGKDQRLRTLIVIFYALALSVLWAVFCIIVFVGFASNAAFDGRGLTALVVSVLPLILLWVVVAFLIQSSRTHAEINSLHAAVRELKDFQSTLEARTVQLIESTYASPSVPADDGSGHETPSEMLVEEDPGFPETGDMIIDHDPVRPGGAAATGTYLDHYDMPAATLIRALNFADGAEDQEAFEAIETAMQNPEIASLMGRAHTILLGLADIDVITDELPVDFSEPHFWRISAPTLTDRSLLMLGEIKSHQLVESVCQMMTQNHDFMARVEEFIERAMPVIRYLAGELNDAEIKLLTRTRCMRALVLVRQAMEQR